MPPLKVLAWAIVKSLIRWRFPTVKPLSTHELAAWLEQPSHSPLLLDARTPEEYHVSHLANAQLAPADVQPLIAQLIAQETISKETPIVVYCSIGYRSARMAQSLQQHGYSQVFNLEGSIFQWANENRPLYQNARVVQTVHPYNSRWKWFLDT